MARTSGIDESDVRVDEAMLAAGRRQRPRRDGAASRHRRRNWIVALVVAIAAAVASCGSSDGVAGPPAGTELSPATRSAESSPISPLDTGPPPSMSPPSTTAVSVDRTAGSPTTSDAGGWVDEVAAVCDHFSSEIAAISETDSAPFGIAAFIAALQDVGGTASFLAAIDGPAHLASELDRIVALGAAADTALDTAAEASAAGDAPAAMAAVNVYLDGLNRIRRAFAVAGVRCGDADPARAVGADLDVPLELEACQVTTGFGSILVSERIGNRVVRLDPASGAVVATIDVASEPFKLQPADGWMWVRTAAQYDAVDPATNTITATLAKADVGPAANRSWAVDGALWICDGRRLHRYNPTTLQTVAALELGVDCGQVHATPRPGHRPGVTTNAPASHDHRRQRSSTRTPTTSWRSSSYRSTSASLSCRTTQSSSPPTENRSPAASTGRPGPLPPPPIWAGRRPAASPSPTATPSTSPPPTATTCSSSTPPPTPSPAPSSRSATTP